MEPRSFDRGKLLRPPGRDRHDVASMEPRSFDRGKQAEKSKRFLTLLLQWSRDRLIAESGTLLMTSLGRACFNGAAIV